MQIPDGGNTTMLQSKKAKSVILFLLGAALGAALYAQAYARLALTIVDKDNKPLGDVKITVTCDEIPDFNEIQITNSKGKANFAFVDGTQTYSFKFEREGYEATSTTVKSELRTTTRRTFILEETGSGKPQPTGKIVYTPAETTFNEGVGLIKENNYAGAKEKFLEALRLDPKLVLAESGLAGIYFEEKDYASAVASAQRLVAAEPSNPRGYRILYDSYKALGKTKEADEVFVQLKGLGAEGDTVAMIYNEGVASLKVGDAKAARERFLEALQLNPELVQAHEALAILYGNQKNYPEAAVHAEKALAHKPDSMTLKRISYDAYKALGDTAKAEAMFQQLIAGDPKALAVQLFNQAIEVFNAGNTQEATDLLEKAVQADPTNSRAHYQLGLCYVNLDQKAKAKEHLKTFIELAPSDPEVEAAKSMLAFLG